MPGLNTVTLLLNGLTLPLALSFLLVALWSDRRKELNQFFAAFLLFVSLWSAGALLTQAVSVIDDPGSALADVAGGLVELGVAGASVAGYVLTAVSVRMHIRRFRWLAFSSLLLVFGYRLILIATGASHLLDGASGAAPSFSGVYYLLFGGGTLVLIWRYHRKIRSRSLRAGLVLFVLGQGLGFLNPALQVVALSLSVCSVAALIIGFAILHDEIIRPLAERNSQVEAIRRVNLAITRQAALGSLLDQIARQAAGLLGADGAGVYLNTGGALQIANVYNLPSAYLGARSQFGEGLAGKAAQTRLSVLLDDYRRDWHSTDDLPLAKQTFGSVICSPLLHGDDSIGALIVVSGRQGRLFGREDAYLLELLGAQAVVAIVHSRLLEEQQALTGAVESARSQLETVLSSTESPVIAIDRRLRLIFANPAARAWFESADVSGVVTDWLPDAALPPDRRLALRELRQQRAHTYEVALGDRIYLCHLAPLGTRRAEGWVAVLNDVTQLKELDRMKSEMVRMTSHDLKNPLQAALANLELLQDDLADQDDPEIHESVEAVEKQLLRMNRIISGILDLERVKTGAQTLEMHAPADIVARAVDEMLPLARDCGVTLTTAVPDALPAFACDAEQFERAIINLVENAIKFTPSGGCVDVRIQQQNGNLVFQVQDTGVGIAEALQPRVFDRFYRGKQKGMEHVTGSGLGLSLVKAIVENHRGKVTLSSREGVGTTFTVSVPIHAAKV
jgi:signal transduction histidine kinase